MQSCDLERSLLLASRRRHAALALRAANRRYERFSPRPHKNDVFDKKGDADEQARRRLAL
jgi:hypothetical protein